MTRMSSKGYTSGLQMHGGGRRVRQAPTLHHRSTNATPKHRYGRRLRPAMSPYHSDTSVEQGGPQGSASAPHQGATATDQPRVILTRARPLLIRPHELRLGNIYYCIPCSVLYLTPCQYEVMTLNIYHLPPFGVRRRQRLGVKATMGHSPNVRPTYVTRVRVRNPVTGSTESRHVYQPVDA